MVIAHIAEVDRRKLFRGLGYPSMHAYCVEALHLSEAAAFNRIAVGRIAREHPRVLDMLAAGELHLAGAKLLAPVLEPGNADRLLDAARHQSKRRIEELVAAERPRPDVPTRVVEIPVPGQLVPGPVSASAPVLAPARVEALAPARYALEVTITAQLRDKLRKAQDLLRHAVPDGDLAEILERGVDLLLERASKRKFASTDKPRRTTAGDDGARIPAAVRRTVAERDGHRCAFVADDGTRCSATAWLEYDHIVPRAKGGPSTVENTRLLCRSHNGFEAERKLGAWVAAMPAKRRRLTSPVRGSGTRQGAEQVERIDPGILADAHAALVVLGYRNREGAALDVLRISHNPTRAPAPGCRERGPRYRRASGTGRPGSSAPGA